MQIKKILLLGILCACVIFTSAQNRLSNISGQIKSISGEPVVGATIKIHKTNYGTITDHNGSFKLLDIPFGNYTLQVSAIGFKSQKKEINVTDGQPTVFSFNLEESSEQMETLNVIGRTANQQVNRQAFNVTSIDAKKLHNSTLDISHALDRVSGVRVREAGGLGSRMDFSLNGFTGRQVKFFIDGVPMDNFGSSFQINNIPINLAQRVEVYKGVVPVWLGSDALGGAINIVTDNTMKSYVDASYSYGSFNTHKTAINAGYTALSGFKVQINAFQNYSDNDYKVTTDVAAFNGTYFRNQVVRRFNDTYHNETLIASAGVVNKKFADQLMFGLTVGQNYSEIQTGARMISVFGDWHRKGSILMPTVKYAKKDLFTKGLDLRVNGNFNFGTEQNIDTVYRRYNWFQDYKEYPGAGSERERSMYKFRNNNGLATTNLSYTVDEHHSLSLNNVFNSFNRRGSDELYPDAEKYEQPRINNKNVLGLGYKYSASEKWNTSVFVKQFYQSNKYSQSYNPSGNWGDVAYLTQRNSYSKTGYGIASTYFIVPNLQVKGSYEKSYRLPETDELFGDLLNLEGNIDLKPEHSSNYNLGFSYQAQLNKIHRFSFDGNVMYRDAKDFIRPSLNNNQTKQVMGNVANVTNLGFESEVRYSFKQLFTAGVNVTYQNLRNNTRIEQGQTMQSPLFRDRIPNMPYLFGNADASLFFNNIGKKGNTLTLGYNVLYVHAYYLSWPSQGTSDTKYDIPRQWMQDVNAVYTLGGGRYNIGLECKNLLDNRIYDNFSLQKPGRAFYAKVRYFFSNNR
ncbi:TonB-dependent receptor [Pedobacter sp. UBA5917]|jgi:outer membrane cobalamin receptor|uniref:TonB-dependent receptor n=1 Tax=Pedobacter sp. UBA5917 TaxID=1947061 RepID=UPI0025E149F0|nr:TonB-dependent receptor [Pedobacter sp. UBA5917]